MTGEILFGIFVEVRIWRCNRNLDSYQSEESEMFALRLPYQMDHSARKNRINDEVNASLHT